MLVQKETFNEISIFSFTEEPETASKGRKKVQNQLSQWAAAKVQLNKWQEEAFKKHEHLKSRLLVKEVQARIDREDRTGKLQEEKLQVEIDILKMKKGKVANELKCVLGAE